MSKSLKSALPQAEQALKDCAENASSLTGSGKNFDLFQSIRDISQFRTEDLRALRNARPGQCVLPTPNARQICSHALLFNLQAMAEFGQRQYPFECHDGALIERPLLKA